MKRITIMAVASILIISFFSLFLYASKDKKIRIINGRIIEITDKYFQLKKGDSEFNLYLSDDTKFITKDGVEDKITIIKICQYAKAYYTIDGKKKILNKIIITKESDCVK